MKQKKQKLTPEELKELKAMIKDLRYQKRIKQKYGRGVMHYIKDENK